MLVEQKIPLGIGLSFHANVSFPFTKSTWSLIIVWKTICKAKSNTATGLKEIIINLIGHVHRNNNRSV